MCGYNDPFENLKDAEHSPMFGAGEHPATDLANDLPGKVHPEHWGNYTNVYDITIPVHMLNESAASAAAANWKSLYSCLSGAQDHHGSFVTKFANNQNWQGEGKEAANKAMADYADALQSLVERVSTMATVVNYTAETVGTVKSAIPSEAEINAHLASSGGDAAQIEAARKELLLYAQKQMTNIYNVGIRDAAASAPTFGAPGAAQTPPPPPGPSVPGGLGGTGGGGGGMGGGGMGKMKSPDISSLTKPTSKIPTPKVPTTPKLPTLPNLPSGLGSALPQALSQAGNLGQSALGPTLGKLQDAASKKLAALGKNPLGSIPGLHALDSLAKNSPHAGLGKKPGAGGGGSGGGAGGAGKLGGGGAGLKGLSDMEKAAMVRGAKALTDAERATIGTVRGATTASPMGGGSPMGAGGAGRGAGEDKEHKTSKYLITTANGETLLGAPPVVTASVIKES